MIDWKPNTEKQNGESKIIIHQKQGVMKVYHGETNKLLKSRMMYKGEWLELWEFLRKDEYSNTEEN